MLLCVLFFPSVIGGLSQSAVMIRRWKLVFLVLLASEFVDWTSLCAHCVRGAQVFLVSLVGSERTEGRGGPGLKLKSLTLQTHLRRQWMDDLTKERFQRDVRWMDVERKNYPLADKRSANLKYRPKERLPVYSNQQLVKQSAEQVLFSSLQKWWPIVSGARSVAQSNTGCICVEIDFICWSYVWCL